MKTLYDQMPLGTETKDRGNVNTMMNNRKFTGWELRRLYFEEYKIEVSWLCRIFYPFIEWLWDQGVIEYQEKLIKKANKVNKGGKKK